jgi:protease-4
MYPPPVFYPPPQPQRGSFARAIFTTLATTILGVSLALNVYLLLASGIGGGVDAITRTTMRSGDATQKIAVIPLNGIILDDAVARFERFLKTASEDRSVKAVVLLIDSPGGGVTASDMIHERLRKFRESKSVPVVVSMGALATSGGYYVACGADHIVAQRTTITGNIGVLLQRFNASGMLERIGVEDTTITSSGAPFKDAGSPFRNETPEEKAYLQSLIDGAFDTFKKVVIEGRHGKLTKPLAEIANGKAFSGEEALRLGLVDEIGYLDDAIAWAMARAGLNNPMVERYDRAPTLGEQLFGVTGSRASPGAVSINVDVDVLRGLAAPKLMYLWIGR